jgi:hypothetical protein
MRLDEIARRASEQVRTASNDMPLLPIEQVGAARRRARLLTAAGLALVAFVAGALTLLPGPPNTPTVTDPTTTETTEGSPGAVRTAAVFTLDDLAAGEERTDHPFLLPWGEGEGQAGRSSGNQGPCCLGIGPDGAVLVLDQANHRVTQVDDTGARTLFSLGDAEAVALTAGLDRVWVLTETTTSRELIAFESDGAEAGRWTVGRGGEDAQLAVSPDRVWIGVTETLPVEAGFAPRQWLDVVDAVTLEPVADQQRVEHRPLPDGRRLGVIDVIDSTVTLFGQDGDGVAWVFPPNVTIVSTDPFLDGVLVTGTSGEPVEYGLSQAWLVRPDGSTEGFAFPHYLHATGLSQTMTAVSGDRLVTLGSNEEGLLVSTVSLERLGTSPPETLDISDQDFLQMTQSGQLFGADGLIADLEDFAMSNGRVAWDGAAGIVYVAADGTLRHLDPDGNREVTADLPEGANSRILATVAGDPTLVGVVAQDALLWIDLVSGERVDRPAGGVDLDPELGPVFTDQGRTVWVDTAGLATAQRGEGGEPLGEYDLPRVVVEDAATGDILTTRVLGTYEQPYLRIHDFDGRRLIVSREPYEPANPPLTVFIIDLECGNCTQVIETNGPHSFTLVGVSQSEGAVVTPSQTPEEAARDGVIPALAALPQNLRVEVLTSFAAVEGTWVVSEIAGSYQPTDGCRLGPPDGEYLVDVICMLEYGEVLLLHDDGSIERAYPMPGSPLSWAHLTPRFLYAGRIGDGALPDSTIIRIDRETLAATVVVLPFLDLGPSGTEWPPGWVVASADQMAAYRNLVGFGPEMNGTPVTSWIGSVVVDLDQIDRFIKEVGG